MRKVANIFEPDYGYIFNEVCYPNDVELPMSQFIEPRIECELAFMLKEDLLGKKISKEDVLNATDYIVCCIEICDFRIFREKHKRVIQDSISDNAAFGAYVLGDKPIKPDEYNLMMVPFVFEYNNKQIETSCGAAVYNDPALSVAWLAERFSELGNPLRKGEMILSGSAVASVNVKANDHLRCAFGPFGEVRCSFI
jgi:2-keto-4-pentenoate hydratase